MLDLQHSYNVGCLGFITLTVVWRVCIPGDKGSRNTKKPSTFAFQTPGTLLNTLSFGTVILKNGDCVL